MKPKEYWIRKNNWVNYARTNWQADHYVCSFFSHTFNPDNYIHVVSYDDYYDLLKENERLEREVSNAHLVKGERN